MKKTCGRLANQQGTALIIALMAMMLLTALGTVVVMVTTTETRIANNHSNAQEALYAADAAVERIMQDLLMIPRWNDILTGSVKSTFADGVMTSSKQTFGGAVLRLCCATDSLTGLLQTTTDAQATWGANNPRWELFAWGNLLDMLPEANIDSSMYVVAWIADDPAEIDGNPQSDTNGTLMLRSEAFGPSNTRKVIEVTVARTASTEIERGQIAQRGQEELNQRARKAAVQTPGSTLTNMRMNTATGSLAVQ
ncbi:MAG TPA: pilus assembly PilX N-terminal domain-containing protein [Vicinamibacterales bacterium]|nr:pilus assembly PilX N-terminal domain-containing protein [Vicinamibacterales bacterium]